MKYSGLDTKHRFRTHNIFKDIIFEKFPNKCPKILDVGCATGVIGRLLDNSKNIYGIEFDPILLKKAKKHCEKVFQIDLNSFDNSTIEEKDFDMIFFGDVLEHLVDPEDVMKQILPLAKDNAYIIVSLPNIAQIQFRIKLLLGKFNYTESGVMDNSHLHFYTLNTAKNFLNNVNLNINEIYPSGTIVSYFNFFPTLLAAQFVFVCQKMSPSKY